VDDAADNAPPGDAVAAFNSSGKRAPPISWRSKAT
jgi:hypothetical protein